MPPNIFSTRAQVAVDSGRLEVRVDTSLVLHRSFAYPVRATSRPEDLDWEVTQDSNGCVCVTFHPLPLSFVSPSFVCVTFGALGALGAFASSFDVAFTSSCVKLSTLLLPPPFTSSVCLECVRMQEKDVRVTLVRSRMLWCMAASLAQHAMGHAMCHSMKPGSKGPRMTRPCWTGGEWCA